MIRLIPTDDRGLDRAQRDVAAHHYLRRPVDARCSPLAYLVELASGAGAGWLIVGRPESTRCYDGLLTYGSLQDVRTGRAQYDRWEVLNLARAWLVPAVQPGGRLYGPQHLPGYVDRRGVWRSTLASTAIGLLLDRVGYDYLLAHPPCFPNEPYELRAVLSYCDTSKHKGTIYRASGFELTRTNERGIETWYTPNVKPLTSYQRDQILKRAGQSYRSRRHRAQRAARHTQETWL